MDILISKLWEWQVLFFLFLCNWDWGSGQLRYSIPEESEPGTYVGNVAQGLNLNIADISTRQLRLGSEKNSRYFSVNQGNGDFVVQERLDRETLCGSRVSCSVTLEIITEQPLELFGLEIEIIDINDNNPKFSTNVQTIRISEALASPGTRFPLESAQDLDTGLHGVSQYMLNSTPYFTLSVKKRKDGTMIPELVIEKTLDREEQASHKLLITAFDGGKPPKSGTSEINVIVLDINDNAPVFDHETYKVTLQENTAPKFSILKLNVTDLDEGLNGEIEYFFDYHTLDSVKQLFDLNQQTGEISVKGVVDYEEADFYEISIRAKDKGMPEMDSRCLVVIEIEDINDNSPEISLTSLVNSVPEDVAVGTAVGFLSVKDKDSGRNGEVKLELSHNLPFTIKQFNNRYSIITDGLLDRETVSQYTLKLIATDLGSPPLSTQTSIILNVSDINDNTPTFSQQYFNAFIEENNDPGSFLCRVSAADLDEGLNSHLVYSLVDMEVEGSPVSSLVYIHANNGNIYAQRSFDYESTQVFQITVKAEDSGSPRRSSTVTIFIFVQDKNDNVPDILHPEHSKEYTSYQRIAKFASSGVWITKVSALDLDSGRNGWLVYNIQDATDPSLFQISAHTGEIRSLRPFQEVDRVEQKLVILVKDHGEPCLSSSVTIIFTVEDKALQEHKSQTSLSDSPSRNNMTLYLIISLAAISVVSLVTFIILIVRCLRKESTYGGYLCCATRPQPRYYTEPYKPTLHLNTDGTLKYMEVRMEPSDPQSQFYQTCLPSAVRQDFTCLKPLNFPTLRTTVNETEIVSGINGFNGSNQAQPNGEWRFSQAQRPGPSGAQPAEEAGVWPNNQFETERLQAMILASANEAAEGTSGLGGGTGTMGLSARYGPQFTLQHVPDYRQNVYIPGSTLTPTNAGGKRDGKGGGNKKKSGKKDKK
ncbi:protocadherin gamma-C5-like isoform X26 [Hyla sarda]|uniref:protocadherin gamma-C5-like isoform X26 n=1 Tax=Hyla sarda TaxID=327740 RepID=UPI0024C2DF04|nr:protocadherin gamma-C5-like isoform X26 [Hyla sarda]